jgi:hypothetical protein
MASQNIEAAFQDESLKILKELKKQGFNKVKWVTKIGACRLCRRLNRKEWTLEEFISNLKYSAPIFEKSHPNCDDTIEVSNDDGDIITVNYEGEMS